MRDPIKQDKLDLELRRTYLGTSEWAICAKINNRYKTPLEVYNEKVNGYTEFDSIRMRVGRDIEPMISKWVDEDLGAYVASDGFVRFHPEHEFLGTNLDGIIHHPDGTRSILEIKTASCIARDTWGAELPEQYYCQIQGQMAITGIEHCKVAILTFGYAGPERFEIQSYNYDPEYFELMVPVLSEFWYGHVKSGTPPDPMNLSDTKLVYPTGNGESIEATQEVKDTIVGIKAIKEQISVLKKEADDLTFQVKNTMGPAEILIYDGRVLATWKNGKGRTTFNSSALKADDPQIYEKYVKRSDSIRTLRIKT